MFNPILSYKKMEEVNKNKKNSEATNICKRYFYFRHSYFKSVQQTNIVFIIYIC